MNITDVRIRKINLEGRMKAIVSVTFDDAFVVHDVKVVEGQKGLFVAMPSKKCLMVNLGILLTQFLLQPEM